MYGMLHNFAANCYVLLDEMLLLNFASWKLKYFIAVTVLKLVLWMSGGFFCWGILENEEDRRRIGAEKLSNESKLQTAMEVLGVPGVNQSNLEWKSLLWNKLGVIP